MFTWIPIYKEIAQAIIPYKNRQTDLIAILREAKDQDINVISLNDQSSDGVSAPLAEIDPFTFFAAFNRNVRDSKRKQLLAFLKDKLSLTSNVPDDFNGIPIMLAVRSWFFSWAYKRSKDDIDSLWKLAIQAIEDEPAGLDKELFKQCIDAPQVSVTNLTMGLFWMRPDKFIALDKNNRALFEENDINSKVKGLPSYLRLLEDVGSKLGTDFPTISHRARVGSSKGDTMQLNRILCGPPGTGKTYKAMQLAVEIVEGKPASNAGEASKRFRELCNESKIGFVTFHQSFSYEDFVEGIRPVIDSEEESGTPGYEVRDGTFKKMCALAGSQQATTIASKGVSLDESKAGFWKMSLGSTQRADRAHIYGHCIQNSFIALGYGHGLDYTTCDNRKAVADKIRAAGHEVISMDYNVTSVNLFKNRMQKGDIVIVSEGNRKFRAIGRITGDYVFDDSFDFEQRRSVEWLAVFEESLPRERILKKAFSQMTTYELDVKDIRVDVLRELISSSGQQGADPYVLVIDEVNRGNISKVLGELITLLEPDKRIGEVNEIQVTLPYSQDPFGVPANLHVIGTMNTADKSIALVDVALRRRFVFEELMPNFGICGKLDDAMRKVLKELNRRITLRKDRDHQIGHSYFMEAADKTSFNEVFKTNILPLLKEYFWNDWEGLRFVLGESGQGSGNFIRRLQGSDVREARNQWQWYSDEGKSDPDCLETLSSNYDASDTANGE